MARIRSTLTGSFAAAIAGGIIVSLLGWAAFAGGLVAGSGTGSGSGAQATSAAPSITPAATPASADRPNTVASIYRHDGRGVVFVEAQQRSAGGTATGSGFVIDRAGHIITNAHVIDGAGVIDVRLGPNAPPVRAKVVGADRSTDVALLQVKAPPRLLHPVPLGDSSAVRVGDSVVAIGNPFGLDRTVTSGIVSALQRRIQSPNGTPIDGAIQTDAAINPGNSGGPLLNAAGQVIGITSQIATGGSGSEGNVGVGFAIPIDTVRQVADGFLSGTGSVPA
jgi:putative serine protease PepD